MSVIGAVLGSEARNISNPAVPLTSANALAYLGGQPTSTGRAVSEEGALRLGTVFACVRLLAETTASLPLQVFRRTSDGKELATEHPSYRILHDRPNPWMTSTDFRKTLAGHLCLWGNAFVEIMFDAAGTVIGLFPLRPDRMERPQLSAAGTLLYRYTLPDGQPALLPQSRVLHIRSLSCDGLWGYSPIQLQREGIGLALTAEEYQGRFFSNNAQPPGVLQAKGQLSPDAAARLASSWNAAHQGLSNAHRIAVLEEGVEWKQVGMPLQDAQFLQLRQYQRSEIASWFRVPPHMIGDVERSTSWGTGIDSQTTGMVVFTLRPDLVNWEQQINVTLFSEAEQRSFFAEHNVDGLLRGDSAARKDFYSSMMLWGVLSPNEVRALENRNPVPGGDQRFVQANMVPLAQAGQAPAPAAPASQAPPNPAAESSSGIDSVEVGRILLNIKRLEDAGEIDLAQKLRDKLGELILAPQRAELRSDPEDRSVASRLRLRGVFRPLLADTFERVVRHEVAAIRAEAKKQLSHRSVEDFLAWVEAFERDQIRPLVEEASAATLTAYASAVESEVLRELDIPALDQNMAPFLALYGTSLSATYSDRSTAQLRQLARKAQASGTSVEKLIEQRLAEWLDSRAGKVADIESVRAGEASAHNTYKRAGINRLEWRETPGRHCAYCNRLNGKVVGIQEHFISAGTELQGGEGDQPMKIRGNKFHPPAHRTCHCVVRPAQ